MAESEKEVSSDLTNSTPEHTEFELTEEDILTFGRSNLNPVLLENILLRFKKFTPVQRKVIPLILSGNDVLIKSQTGSGKTLAALIPLLNLLLDSSGSFSVSELKFLIVVPSNDLVHQVCDLLKVLLKKCNDKISFKGITDLGDSLSNVVVTKPSIANELVKDQKLLFLVIDEADLLFEFGYKNDTLKLVEFLRSNSKFKSFQSVMLSATLSLEIKDIANLLLYKPIFVDIPYTEELGNVNEYYMLVQDNTKLLTLYILLKLESIPYGSLIFVNSNKKGYHLYCFLRKLCLDINIISKLLSPKLRHSILQSFNQGLLGCLIIIDDDTDEELSLSRGVDFKNVNCVINFDEPNTLDIYKHRIGRTGRNYKNGSSLTFFTKSDNNLLLQLTSSDATNSTNPDESNPLNSEGENSGLKLLSLDETMLESFRYRINDVLKTITPKLVEIAQAQSVRHSAIEQEEFLKNINENEILLLKSVLKNDNQLLKPEKSHLTFIPKYLVNNKLENVVNDIKYKIYPSNAKTPATKNKRFNKRDDKDFKKRDRKSLKMRRRYYNKKLPRFKPKKK